MAELTLSQLYDFAEEEYQFAPEVKGYLRRLGIVPMAKPDGTSPGPPKGLSRMGAEELGDLYDRYMEWYAYFAGEVTELRIEATSLREWRQHCLDDRQLARTDIPKVDRALHGRMNRGYIEANAEFLACEQKLAGVEAEMKRMSKHATQVSRHITLRQDGTDMGRRSGNMRGYAPAMAKNIGKGR